MCRSTISARWCASSRSCSSFRDVVAKQFLERLQAGNRLVMSEIEMERRDCDVSVLDRIEVRSLGFVPLRRLPADPVVLPPSRIAALDDTLGVDAPAQRRDP